MCTAITLKTRDLYFGRTLDYPHTWGEEITITPRNFPLAMRHRDTLTRHYAIIGTAHISGSYPLYYDAVNESGLAMAGLNFPGNACYFPPVSGKENIAQFELIPWVLGTCASLSEARQVLAGINITDTAFSRELSPAPLHWLLADRTGAVTVEPMADGIRIHDNPLGVLTNNPPFEMQLWHLSNFLNLTPAEAYNRFAEDYPMEPCSQGMGAMGLPGDLSSPSRFVRAAFGKLNSQSGSSEMESVSQFFHILDTVGQTRGCCRLEGEAPEITQYTSCCNTRSGIYYYSTYENRAITAVDLHRENPEGSRLIRYPMITAQQIQWQN